MRAPFLPATLSIAFGGAAHALPQELLANGGFEGPPRVCTTTIPLAGSTTIAGWTVLPNGNIDWVGGTAPATCACPYEGGYFIDLNGEHAPSGVWQSVATVPGHWYELSFRAVSNDFATASGVVKTVAVAFGTQSSIVVLPPTTRLDCVANFPWTGFTLEFEAIESTTRLEIRSNYGPSPGGIYLDAVSLVRVACPPDLDGSGAVNGVDLAVILQNWGAPTPKYPQSDIDGDGLVNGADLAIVLSSWGACP